MNITERRYAKLEKKNKIDKRKRRDLRRARKQKLLYLIRKEAKMQS